MESVPLDQSLWEKIPVSSNKGMNTLEYLFKVVREKFPGWEPAAFTEQNLEQRRTEDGYVVLTTDHWRQYAGDWNDEVALRYRITESDGAIKWNRLFICVRPIWFGDQRRAYQWQQQAIKYEAARRGKAAEIRHSLGRKFDIGSSIVENRSNVNPMSFTEGDEDENEQVYENAKIQIQVPELPEPLIAKRSKSQDRRITLQKKRGPKPKRAKAPEPETTKE